jgi:histidine ammonia-lyase
MAIELTTATRGLDLRSPLAPARATAAARDALRARVDGPGPDRYLAIELEAADGLVATGAINNAAERAIGSGGLA